MPRSHSPPPRAPRALARQRRTADEARAAILDAAERRLVASGPAGIRLQEVAADVGVSHPTVLHHFGSREALVQAVCARSMAAIHADVVKAIGESAGGEDQLVSILDRVMHALTSGGHGRIVLWLALEGFDLGHGPVHLSDVVTAAQAQRKRKRGEGAKPPPRSDTTYTVVLASLVLVAESVLGPAIFEDVGLGDAKAAGAGFRAWLAHLIVDHFERGFTR